MLIYSKENTRDEIRSWELWPSCLQWPQRRLRREVIYNPGYCAQFYPNANCQNKGPNNPYTGDYQLRNQLRGAFARSANPCAQGAQSYRGHDGRRYFCH